MIRQRRFSMTDTAEQPESGPPKESSRTEADEMREFVGKVEVTLEPAFAEVLSEETRKSQRALLVLSFLLLLIARGAVQFSGEVELAGLKFAGPTAAHTVLAAGCLVCLYLELLVAMRCLSEWRLWRLKTRAGELEFETASLEFAALINEANVDVLERGFVGLRDDVSPEKVHDLHKTYDLPEPMRAALARLYRIRQLRPHYAWFKRNYTAYKWTRRLRLLLEIFFPLTFAAAAIAYSLVTVLRIQ